MAKKELTKKNDPKIELIETSLLIPYARNSRLHSEKQIDQIAASIREFGFINPIIIDSENGLIAGHGRVSAAKKLGLEKVPCIRADHLTEAQKRAYVIADNRLAELSSWDNEMLKVELEDLVLDNFDLGLVGFDEDYVNKLLAPVEADGNLKQVEGAQELDFNNFSNFEHKCPKCGFEYNEQK